MEIKISELDGVRIAELISAEVEIRTTQDALDLMMEGIYQGAGNIVIKRQHLSSEFFDLKNGIAGDILQKFATYNARLAIIGNFADPQKKSLRDFIYETNKTKRILLVESLENALELWTDN